jgi:hypothetical protein
MDLHPADGVFSALSGCTQWHSKGVYQIPYRCLYSRNIGNLFVTGRLISVTHVAFGSTRVMATCASHGQAVGMAAALASARGVTPRDVPIPELQRALLRAGQHIPGVHLEDPEDLAPQANLRSSSCFELEELRPNGEVQPLDTSRAMLIPVPAGPIPAVTFLVDVSEATTLEVEVRAGARPENYTPEAVLHAQSFALQPGKAQPVRIANGAAVEAPRYLSYCLLRNPSVSVHLSDLRVSGVLSLSQSMNKAVAKGARQEPPPGSGIDSFEFWLPARRPGGHNLALAVEPPLRLFCGRNVVNGIARPGLGPNAWVAAPDDGAPSLTLRWDAPRTIRTVELCFDTDLDHPMESVFWNHPERDMPFCVRSYRLAGDAGQEIARVEENHQTRNTVRLEPPVITQSLTVEVLATHGAPATVFAVRCYA